MKPTSDRFNSYQIMWVVVFFDLPTETKIQRKRYADFRKALISDGFTMFQYSIYVRHCPSRENMEVHINRVSGIIPEEGKVCIITLTDKQFSSIKIFEGRKKADPCVEAIQLEIW
ncbi:MAG: CRISPR-associated endonuclease Cas2 [Lachnospiraceae bacterium]|nr:CRISPR-associated endonuclease Cas2 [Lachnospiraceae bacterium]